MWYLLSYMKKVLYFRGKNIERETYEEIHIPRLVVFDGLPRWLA